MTGRIFNIQHYSLHDGPGIRTVVFLKGCPLRCIWCCNPESQHSEPEIYFDQARCIWRSGCDLCAEQCASGAVGGGELDRNLCTGCLRCADACPSKALAIYGEEISADELVKCVEKQRPFFAHGGGGLTLSGGEPAMQAGFAAEILEAAGAAGISTAVETCGYCSQEDMRRMIRHTDHIIFDIKMMDSGRHRTYTGVGNEIILDNLQMIFREHRGGSIIVRTPVIPGINDAPEDLQSIRDHLGQFDGYRYELLPYHRLGENKYRMLGRQVPCIDAPASG